MATIVSNENILSTIDTISSFPSKFLQSLRLKGWFGVTGTDGEAPGLIVSHLPCTCVPIVLLGLCFLLWVLFCSVLFVRSSVFFSFLFFQDSIRSLNFKDKHLANGLPTVLAVSHMINLALRRTELLSS